GRRGQPLPNEFRGACCRSRPCVRQLRMRHPPDGADLRALSMQDHRTWSRGGRTLLLVRALCPRRGRDRPPRSRLNAGADIRAAWEAAMGTVARVTEISPTSDQSFEDAITTGISRAAETLRQVRSAWIKEMHVDVADGRVYQYRVNMLVTFVLEG